MVPIVWNCPMNSALHVVLRLSSFLFACQRHCDPTSTHLYGYAPSMSYTEAASCCFFL